MWSELPKISSKDYTNTNRRKKEKVTIPDRKRKLPKQRPTNDNLFDQLTKISPEDYIGKEICKICNKVIGTTVRAISCDACDRWTHLKCSGMTSKEYSEHGCTDFPWSCSKCKKSDVRIEVKLDVNRLSYEQMPETNEDIRKQWVKDFLILHYNFRSLSSKLEEFHNICNELKPSIICITETWLDNSHGPEAYIPDGYCVIRHDRSNDFQQKYRRDNGGGVAIFHKKELKIRKLANIIEPEETLWIEVKSKPSFILGTIYRSEYTDLLNEKENGTLLEKQLNEMTTINNNIVVIGDLNCDTEIEEKDKCTRTLLEVFDGLTMKQLIEKPTRIDPKSKRATTIDHVWADTNLSLIKSFGTIDGVSDHTGIYAIINTSKEKAEPEKFRYRCYKNYNPEDFNKDLEHALTDPALLEQIEIENVDDATETFVRIFTNTAEKHAPMKEGTTSKKNKNIPWFTPQLGALIAEKSRRLKLYWMDGFLTDLNVVKAVTNKITHCKRKLKKIYYSDKIAKYDGDPKKMWKILNEVTQTEAKKNEVEPEFIDQNKADTFNTFFRDNRKQNPERTKYHRKRSKK